LRTAEPPVEALQRARSTRDSDQRVLCPTTGRLRPAAGRRRAGHGWTGHPAAPWRGARVSYLL